MVAERPDFLPHFKTFDFYRGGKCVRTEDPELFRQELDELLARKRPARPEHPGTFLLLRKDALRYLEYNRLQTILRFRNRLIRSGFKDHFNWELGDKHDPVNWWSNKLALDIVGLPAFSDRDGRNSLVRRSPSLYRLFTRPSYISKKVTNR
jgi:hypothetical protein